MRLSAVAMILTGTLMGADAPPLKTLQERYPLAFQAFVNWDRRIEMDPIGFFKGPKDHRMRFEAERIILRSLKAGYKIISRLPPETQDAKVWVQWTFPDGRQERRTLEQYDTEKIGVQAFRVVVLPELPEGTRILEHEEGTVPGIYLKNDFEVLPERSVFLGGQIQFTFPTAYQLKVRNPHGDAGAAKLTRTTDAEGRLVTRLDMTGLQAWTPEVLAPYQPRAEFVEWRMVSGNQYFLTSGARLGNVYRSIVDRDSFFNSVLDRLVAEAIGNATTPRQKAEAALAYVRKEFKLIDSREDSQSGLFGGKVTMDFKHMVERKEASAEGAIALVKAILGKADVPADMVMLVMERKGPLDSDFLDASETFVPALWMELDGKPVVTLPQQPTLKLGELPYWALNRPALVVDTGDPAKVRRTPAHMPGLDRTEDRWTLTVGDKAQAVLTVEREATGPSAMLLKEQWRKKGAAEKAQPRFSERMLACLPPGSAKSGGIKEDDSQPAGIAATGLKAALTYEYPVVMKREGERLVIAPPLMAFPFGDFGRAPLAGGPRVQPLWIPVEQVQRRVLRIRMPKGTGMPQTLPAAARVENALGMASSECRMEGDDLVLDQSLLLKAGLHAPERDPELRALVGKGSPLDLPPLSFQ